VIARSGGGSLLARFVADLAAQAPSPLDARAFDRARHTDGDLEAARWVWAGRVVDEYRSVVVFSDLLTRLAALQAPLPALACLNRLVADELRHTVLCAEVSGWMGPFEDLDVDLADLGPPPPSADERPAVRVLETIVRELVVAEAESLRVLVATRRAASDPTVRSALDILVADEARHAAAGKSLERLLVAHLPAEDVAIAAGQRARWAEEERDHARAVYARAATGGPGRALGASLELGDL
jgi:hypothetical protein